MLGRLVATINLSLGLAVGSCLEKPKVSPSGDGMDASPAIQELRDFGLHNGLIGDPFGIPVTGGACQYPNEPKHVGEALYL